MAEFEAATQGDTSGGGSSYAMAEVNTEQSYEQVRFKFLGYSDTADAGRYSHLLSSQKDTASTSDTGNGDEDQAGTVTRVRYRSNGTCRPYRVKVFADSADGEDASFSLTVVVDMLGVAKVEEDE